ncbi:MAG: phosphoenolpyruvate synthase, partial [Betaproteobacteria bacterium]|nr:phosphoenolpyruvate synthase [Betaproteobacteria bacterium]
MSALFHATDLVVPFELLRMTDVESVGGKNASLGEMISQLPDGVRVPTGFATTSYAFKQFLKNNDLGNRINSLLQGLDTNNLMQLSEVGQQIRESILGQPFPKDLEDAIRFQFKQLNVQSSSASYAVRSSATAEDLPDASFAGQQESFLNVEGIDQVLVKVKEV